MSFVGIYHVGKDWEHFLFQYRGRAEMHHIYQRLLKEGFGDHKYFRCPDLQDNNFEVTQTDIQLDGGSPCMYIYIDRVIPTGK